MKKEEEEEEEWKSCTIFLLHEVAISAKTIDSAPS